MSAVEAQAKIQYRVVHEHFNDPNDDFHEWIWQDKKVKANRLGHPNANMLRADWQLVRCNNIDCPAQALIYMGDILDALPPVQERAKP